MDRRRQGRFQSLHALIQALVPMRTQMGNADAAQMSKCAADATASSGPATGAIALRLVEPLRDEDTAALALERVIHRRDLLVVLAWVGVLTLAATQRRAPLGRPPKNLKQGCRSLIPPLAKGCLCGGDDRRVAVGRFRL
jgi:hypothetical protein